MKEKFKSLKRNFIFFFVLLLSRKKNPSKHSTKLRQVFYFSLFISLLHSIQKSVQRERSLRLWRVSKKMVNDFNGFQIKTSSDERADRSETKWNMKDFFLYLNLMLMQQQYKATKREKLLNMKKKPDHYDRREVEAYLNFWRERTRALLELCELPVFNFSSSTQEIQKINEFFFYS